MLTDAEALFSLDMSVAAGVPVASAPVADATLTVTVEFRLQDGRMTYGNIVSVYVGPDKRISAMTDGGVEELTDMIRAARLPPKTRHEFRV